MRLLLAAGLVAAAAIVATTAASTAAPAPASCTTGSGGGGSGALTLVVGGHARTVLVHVRSNATGGRRLPLVLDLHGSASTAAQQEKFSAMDATADAHDFVVAYPQALIPDGRGFDWNIPGAPLVGGRPVPHGAADDVAFLTGLVHVLEQRDCVDPRAVYATGFSGGGRMASQLVCDASSTFAAVAPVSGLRYPSHCVTRRPVPIVAFHGTADPVDPYRGHGEVYWTYSVPAAARDWARHDRCALTPRESHPAGTVTLTRYTRCGDAASVELYTIAGEGHEWPGGPPLPPRYAALLGPQSNAIDADETMWSFFAAHRLR